MTNEINAHSATVQQIFSAYRLHLPLYQRPYVWQEAAKKLLDDIYEAYERSIQVRGVKYFIGNLLTVNLGRGPTEVDIADGQQRLTTLFILFAGLNQLSTKMGAGCEVANWVKPLLSRRFGPEGSQTTICSPRLAVAEAFTLIARDGVLPKAKAKIKNYGKTANPVAAYQHVGGLVHDWITEHLSGVTQLTKFCEFVFDKVYAVVITYPDESTALSVFENINARGEKLIQADLLKSAFMKMAETPKEWETIDSDWDRILTKASARKGGADGFLRKATLAVLFPAFAKPTDFPRNEDLLKRITDYCRETKLSARTVLQKISEFADAQSCYEGETPTFCDGTEAEVLYRLRALPSRPEFVSTLIACIPASLTQYSKIKIALAIESAACVIGLLRGASKNVSYLSQPLCAALRALPEEGVSAFCCTLHEKLVGHHLTDFKEKFAKLRICQEKPADLKWGKYFLLIVEAEFRDRLDAAPLAYGKAAKSQVKAATIEHVIPQSQIPRIPPETVFSIGNCTLLERTLNSSIQDSAFDKKLKVYGSSDFRITRELTITDNGANTQRTRFLHHPAISGIWNHPNFSERAVETRADTILSLILSIWGISDAYAPAISA